MFGMCGRFEEVVRAAHEFDAKGIVACFGIKGGLGEVRWGPGCVYMRQ